MAKRKTDKPVKVMVASTVYGYENELAAIYNLLDGLGYEVMNSSMGTVYAGADKSNKENCLKAVKACDAFIGIIRPQYGSGVIGELSITHTEVLEAILQKKARGFLVDSKVVFTRQLLRETEFVERNALTRINPNAIVIRPNKLIDVRSIEIYNEVIKDKVKPEQRVGHWAHEYYDLTGILRFIEAQFSSVENVKRTIAYMKKLPK
jgi:hypothetical protein